MKSHDPMQLYQELRISSLNALRKMAKYILSADDGEIDKDAYAAFFGAAAHLARRGQINRIFKTQDYQDPTRGEVGLTKYLCRNAPQRTALTRLMSREKVEQEARMALLRKNHFTTLFGGMEGFDPECVREGVSQPDTFILANMRALKTFQDICKFVAVPMMQVEENLSDHPEAEQMKIDFEKDVICIAEELDRTLIKRQMQRVEDPLAAILHPEPQQGAVGPGLAI